MSDNEIKSIGWSDIEFLPTEALKSAFNTMAHQLVVRVASLDQGATKIIATDLEAALTAANEEYASATSPVAKRAFEERLVRAQSAKNDFDAAVRRNRTEGVASLLVLRKLDEVIKSRADKSIK